MFDAPEYRVVNDAYMGFSVEIRRWWWPWWAKLSGTYGGIEAAEAKAFGHAGGVVKHLGRWTGEPAEQVADFAPLDAEGFGIAVMSMAKDYVRDTPLATRQEHAKRMGWTIPQAASPLNPDGHDDYYYAGR